MSNSPLTQPVEPKGLVTISVFGPDGQPDPEALEDLANYLAEHGIDVTTVTSTATEVTPEP
jgi:dihydrodipicolinate synthase/N-acetylneuraminate lyase